MAARALHVPRLPFWPLLWPLLWLLPALGAAEEVGTTLPILCYHDVRDDVEGDLDPDEHAVSTRALVEQFDWLLAHGYTPVTVDQLLAAERGTAQLPSRPILLTFDDGYASFYHRVLPLLRAYRFPAVLSVVGSWLEVPADGFVDYGGRQVPRSRFLSWAQLREVSDSPWVEVASHSFDLHHGVPGNRKGNTQPAANTRALAADEGDLETAEIESIEKMQRRVRDDLARNRELLASRLGTAPRLMAWPYGEAAGWAFEAARDIGFEASLLLGDELAHLDGRHVWQRILVSDNPSLGRWVWQLRAPAVRQPLRALEVRLSDLAPNDPQEVQLSKLLERVVELHVGAVYLVADGTPESANRVAWQLRTRTPAHVWLRLPTDLDRDILAQWASKVPVRGWLVEGARESGLDELERAREVLAEYRTVARVASTADSAREALDRLERAGLDHVVVSSGLDLAPDLDFRQDLDPDLAHRLVFAVGREPAAEDLERLQGQGFLSLVVRVPVEDLDDHRLDRLRRHLSSAIFPYPRP